MTRRRLGMIAGGLVVAFAFASVSAMAQDQGRGGRGGRGGPGGGGPGGGGPGGGFGRGGPGGGFGMFGGRSLVDLATREPVQEELKLTDEQKEKIKKLAEESRAKRDKAMQDLRERMQRDGGGPGGGRDNGGRGNGGDNGGRRGRDGASLAPSRSTTTGVIRRASYQPQDGFGGYGQGFGGGFGGNPYTGEPQQGVDPAVQRQLMQQQQQEMQNQRNQFQRQMGENRMMQTMQKLRKDDEAALAKILKPEQLKRLREISVQMAGPFAILRDQELAQKLNVTEDQYGRIQDIEQADRERRRNNGGGFGGGDGMRSLMEKFRATQPQAQNQGNDNNGGRGGRGNFDREAFQKFLEKPENKAEMDKIREQGEKARQQEAAIRDQNFSKVLATLDRGQASKYRAMLGNKFDTDGLMRGMFGGPGGNRPAPQTPPGAATAGTATPKAEATAANAATPKAEAKAATPKAATADTKSAAPAARTGSLRDRRGLGGTTKPQ